MLSVCDPLRRINSNFDINFLGAAALVVGRDPFEPTPLRAEALRFGPPDHPGNSEAPFARNIPPPLSAWLVALLDPQCHLAFERATTLAAEATRKSA